ncbi:NADP-dependent oxidoreductase [Xanthovirga aplysinae]|uniref:NADP-dependent oxidoreductase n=1 Tax=Xanthovirga aplysinae TaxID=2529853 RepID=UPI0012BBD83A|nr:NADP-dependent oxidoreductase [Xanthovirga aplysinae]MTI32459.1 NADP-dependent oxidoreductase [Xanthovirga aplysinae]
MKALQITGYGKDIRNHLKIAEVKKPKAKAGEVLIEVHAASINPIDYKIVHGLMKIVEKLDFPAPIGFDVSGTIVSVGKGVQNFKEGDEVFSRVGAAGTLAEFVAVDATLIAPKPHNFSHEEAASIPLVGLTTLQTIKSAMKANPGQKILIHAGSGGVGSFAIQYAKALELNVATTTSTKNVEWVKALGADQVIDYKKENYLELLKDLDYVYDTLGGQYTIDSFKILKTGGKTVSIAGPPDQEFSKNFGLNPIFKFFIWLGNRKVYRAAKAKSNAYQFLFLKPSGEQLDEIRKLIEDGKIKAIIDKKFSLDESIDALEYLQSGRTKGKVVVTVK